jgi:hypothetical protein
MKHAIALVFALATTTVFGQDLPVPPVFNIVPAQGITVSNIKVEGGPPLFGPVLKVIAADGTMRASIEADGSLVFQHGATIGLHDITLNAGKIRGFAYIWLGASGEYALVPVFALPGDGRVYNVTIEKEAQQ